MNTIPEEIYILALLLIVILKYGNDVLQLLDLRTFSCASPSPLKVNYFSFSFNKSLAELIISLTEVFSLDRKLFIHTVDDVYLILESHFDLSDLFNVSFIFLLKSLQSIVCQFMLVVEVL